MKCDQTVTLSYYRICNLSIKFNPIRVLRINVAKFVHKIYTAFLTEEHATFSAAFYGEKFRWDFELFTNRYLFCSFLH
jgi:hypothetical protein